MLLKSIADGPTRLVALPSFEVQRDWKFLKHVLCMLLVFQFEFLGYTNSSGLRSLAISEKFHKERLTAKTTKTTQVSHQT
jgi:hypothetical protein